MSLHQALTHHRDLRIERELSLKDLKVSKYKQPAPPPPSYSSLYMDKMECLIESSIRLCKRMRVDTVDSIRENVEIFAYQVMRKSKREICRCLDVEDQASLVDLVALVIVAVAIKFEFNDYFEGYMYWFKRLNFVALFGSSYRHPYYNVEMVKASVRCSSDFCYDINHFELLMMKMVAWSPFVYT